MSPKTRPIVIAATSALLVAFASALTGCSSTAVYEESEACSVPSEIVTDVLGTDRYTASSADLPGSPIAAMRDQVSCFIETDDDILRILVDARGDDFVADRRANLEDSRATPFDLAGGLGLVTEGGGAWVCGNVWLTAMPDEKPLASEDAMRSALESLADTVGCFTSE